MNIIILTSEDYLRDDLYQLSDSRATHIRSILKSKPGDSLEIGILNGPIGTAIIQSVTDEAIILKLAETSLPEVTNPTIDIICALPRPQTLKKILFTAAMMGVRNLHLVRANRTEKSYLQSPMISPENQLPHLIEGLSQGKRTTLPQVTLHPLFRPFAEDTWPQIQSEKGASAVSTNTSTTDVLLLPDMDTKDCGTDIEVIKQATAVTIAIGPEGGWVDFEIEHFKKLGFIPFSLGPWVLRVEHALTASLAQIELLISSADPTKDSTQ